MPLERRAFGALLLQQRLPHRMFSFQPIAYVSKDSAYFSKPTADEALRPYQGMDMRKLISCPWVNVLETRKPKRSGIQWGGWGLPHVDAFNYADVPMFFTQRNYWNEYTLWQTIKLAYPHLRYALMYTVNLLIAAGPSIAYCFWSMKWEPPEYNIEPDEYFENYRWHYYGPSVDHHGFTQYLEARRAKKWRDPSIDPTQWIPPHYRGDKGFVYP